MRSIDEEIARHLQEAAASGELSRARGYGKPAVEDPGWEDTPAAYDGEFYQFANTYFSPKPDRSRLKLWFGGMEFRPSFVKKSMNPARPVFAFGLCWM